MGQVHKLLKLYLHAYYWLADTGLGEMKPLLWTSGYTGPHDMQIGLMVAAYASDMVLLLGVRVVCKCHR